jgi:hypothetical protein
VFELVHIVLSPTGVDLLGPFWAASPVTPALAAVATVVISFGLAVIPRLTLSLVGLLVGAANLLALMTGQTCRDLGGVLMIAGMFVLVWWLAQRLR